MLKDKLVHNDIADSVEKATEQAITEKIISLEDSSRLKRVLSHFKEPMRAITRSDLDACDPNENKCVIWKISEECYNQAIGECGVLQFDHYAVTRGEAALGRLYDADYESEQYYGHEDRSDLRPSGTDS